MKGEKMNGWRLVVLVGLALLGALSLGGCKEKEVPYVVDSAEIESYMRHSQDALDLFRIEGLINPVSHYRTSDSSTITDSVLSSKRSYEIHVSDDPQDYGNYGNLYEAVVIVRDSLAVRVTRVKGDSTSSSDKYWLALRYGIFLKLGADNQPYVGWQLWGFFGVGATSMGITSNVGNVNYACDSRLYTESVKDAVVKSYAPKYVKVRSLMSIGASDTLKMTVYAPSKTVPVLSSVNGTSDKTAVMTLSSPDVYVNSVVMPSSYDRVLDVAVVQCYSDSLWAGGSLPTFVPWRVVQ